VCVGPGIVRVGPGILRVGTGVLYVGAGIVCVGPGIAHVGPGIVHVGPGIVYVGPGIAHVGPGIAHVGPGIVHVGAGIVHVGPGIACVHAGVELPRLERLRPDVFLRLGRSAAARDDPGPRKGGDGHAKRAGEAKTASSRRSERTAGTRFVRTRIGLHETSAHTASNLPAIDRKMFPAMQRHAKTKIPRGNASHPFG
jgi:hypothetical protein